MSNVSALNRLGRRNELTQLLCHGQDTRLSPTGDVDDEKSARVLSWLVRLYQCGKHGPDVVDPEIIAALRSRSLKPDGGFGSYELFVQFPNQQPLLCGADCREQTTNDHVQAETVDI